MKSMVTKLKPKVDNKSGIFPLRFAVLVLPDKVEEKTQGGIIMPPEAHEQEPLSIAKMTVIAVGPMAFTKPDWPSKPEPGDRVIVDRYSGKYMTGDDDEDYRLVNDDDLLAITR